MSRAIITYVHDTFVVKLGVIALSYLINCRPDISYLAGSTRLISATLAVYLLSLRATQLASTIFNRSPNGILAAGIQSAMNAFAFLGPPHPGGRIE